jgi:hypothetical protein
VDFLQSNAILSGGNNGTARASTFNNYFSDSTRFFDHTRVNITDITTTYTTPLDLRATPIPDASSMSADVQQQSARSVFKMNPDFWQQARGPPSMPPGPNLGQPPTGGGGGGGGGGTQGAATGGPTPPGAAGGLNNTQNNTVVNNNQGGGGNGGAGGGSSTPDSKMMTEKLVNELQVSGPSGMMISRLEYSSARSARRNVDLCARRF